MNDKICVSSGLCLYLYILIKISSKNQCRLFSVSNENKNNGGLEFEKNTFYFLLRNRQRRQTEYQICLRPVDDYGYTNIVQAKCS